MKIQQIRVWPIALTMLTPFKTAHGTTQQRPLQVIELTLDSGHRGYGEVQAFADQSYAKQDQATARQELLWALPKLIGQTFQHPKEFARRCWGLTSFAKAGVEMALWDAYGHLKQQSLAQLLAVDRMAVPVSAAVGVQNQQLEAVHQLAQQDYQRLKIKAVNPQTALAIISELHHHFPNQLLSLDPNAAWPNDALTLRYIMAMQSAGLTLIEEPVYGTSLVGFQRLQGQLKQVKLSLDESLTSLASVYQALQVDAAAAYTLKQGKLGGLTATLDAIEAVQHTQRLPWIGGMLASGLGRSLDLVLAAKTGAKSQLFPADIAASNHYFVQDIIKENLTLHNGQMDLPTGSGLGVTIDLGALANMQVGPVFSWTGGK